MTFKHNWEKKDQHVTIPIKNIEGMLVAAFPNQKMIAHEVISGGCANINIKIQLAHDEYPRLLRIYLQDKAAAFREQKIGALLAHSIPVPRTYYIGEYEGYCFAITQFMEGITLRQLLLGNLPYDVSAIMYDVGVVLAKITAHEFPTAGFFDKNLNVMAPTAQDDYLTFTKTCVDSEAVRSQLASNTIAAIHHVLNKYGHYFPEDNEKNLVHADFDPANILVNAINGVWKVTAVLDWEFSFSGPRLLDVANMLRYAHHMPSEFSHAFLEGLSSKGITLPKNWRVTVHMLNLLSLLDCLERADPEKSPQQCADICELINHLLEALN